MEEKLHNMRHSCSHLLAAAVLELYPDTKVTIGPPVENGFYYDFDFKNPISEDYLPKIEGKMRELLKGWNSFERIEKSADEAKEEYKHNPYKRELIEELEKKGEKITFYKSGNFVDLCRGGHVENPSKEIGAFKLLSLAGAYWRADKNNQMLTRIYGTCFPTQKELDNYINMLEEAKKRDHRKIGEILELFTISEEVGQGLILWLPKGNIIKEELEKWDKQVEREWGYQRVTTPHITKSRLYYTSGHLPYYKNDMYPPMKVNENEEYFLKPMNCPHHHMIYKSKPRSYRDLPFRLAEFGTCYRYESSGELFGLMRVRGFTQNDSHIYCTIEQAVDEFLNVMKLHEYLYKVLGIKEYHLELGLRDPNNQDKYHGNAQMWKQAEELMREAVMKTDIRMVEKVGSAAFYGPKIDFIIHSSIGREFAISTNQLDLYMGPRFNLKYTDKDGQEKVPAIIHRAPLGSDERFIGFLIEHYAGLFPTWLSPVQVEVIPISEKNNEYSKKVNSELVNAGIRSELNDKNDTMQAKIREATLQKIPYMCIIGDREEQSSGSSNKNLVSVRERSGKNMGQIKLAEFIVTIKKEIENRV